MSNVKTSFRSVAKELISMFRSGKEGGPPLEDKKDLRSGISEFRRGLQISVFQFLCFKSFTPHCPKFDLSIRGFLQVVVPLAFDLNSG